MMYLLSHILDASAQRDPDHEAMRFGGRSMTYGDWLRRADALARVLVEHGVVKGDRVGIFMNKSLETAVAIYGIWKAGAAYVPLDPLAPVSRLGFALNDCAIRHVVTQEGKADVLRELTPGSRLECAIGVPPGQGLPARCVTWAEVDAEPAGAPPIRMLENDLAYVMYTSGSTGAPKGLMHTHHSGLSYARLSAKTYEVSATDRLANHSPLHFDMSTFEYFTGPLCGATTVIVPEPVTKFPASMSKLIEDERITIWYSVTTALMQMLMRGVLDQRNLSSLRWVNYGGEPFPPAHLRELMKLVPGARFSNVYGPAEVNQCTYYHLPDLPDDYAESIPIGHVWDDTEAVLLDDGDGIVAPGDIGELAVRSPTMMRGYWNRPDLNERAFYRRPVFGVYEDVFYRTGDLMKVDSEGLLRFCGRKDRQIKTRGYRVELDEVETALSLHPAVGECAVFSTPDGQGSHVIRAAVIPKNACSVDEATLKRSVGAHVPMYAVPLTIEIVNEFPRTGTGKIDRLALRQRALQQVVAGAV